MHNRLILIVLISAIIFSVIFVNLVPRKITYRIDDVWAFTDNRIGHNYTFENLKRTLEVLEGQKVVLGVTPFFFDGEKEIPLADDPELITFLKEKQKEGMTIALHGYNHRCGTDDICEFEKENFETCRIQLDKGKEYLEDFFGKITIYTPPKNHISPNLKLALNVQHLKLINFGYDPITEWYWFNNTIDWRGFSDYSNEKYIIIHYNAVDLEDLKEFVSKHS